MCVYPLCPIANVCVCVYLCWLGFSSEPLGGLLKGAAVGVATIDMFFWPFCRRIPFCFLLIRVFFDFSNVAVFCLFLLFFFSLFVWFFFAGFPLLPEMLFTWCSDLRNVNSWEQVEKAVIRPLARLCAPLSPLEIGNKRKMLPRRFQEGRKGSSYGTYGLKIPSDAEIASTVEIPAAVASTSTFFRFVVYEPRSRDNEISPTRNRHETQFKHWMNIRLSN